MLNTSEFATPIEKSTNPVPNYFALAPEYVGGGGGGAGIVFCWKHSRSVLHLPLTKVLSHHTVCDAVSLRLAIKTPSRVSLPSSIVGQQHSTKETGGFLSSEV